MEKINFVEGQLVQEGFVVVDGKTYKVTEAEYSGDTPLSPKNLNQLQDNIEKELISQNKKITEIENKNSDQDTKLGTHDTEIANLQKGQSVTYANILVSSPIPANTEYTLPCKYKVGNKSLRVHWENVLLEEGENGNYMEIGEPEQASDKIKFGWNIEPGETLIVETRGVIDE